MAPKSPPGRTTGWGARAVAIGEEEEGGGRGRGSWGGRKGKRKGEEDGEGEEGMPVDPNEPTYCFCDRVSFGKVSSLLALTPCGLACFGEIADRVEVEIDGGL